MLPSRRELQWGRRGSDKNSQEIPAWAGTSNVVPDSHPITTVLGAKLTKKAQRLMFTPPKRFVLLGIPKPKREYTRATLKETGKRLIYTFHLLSGFLEYAVL
jgi:hypothetical protein